MSDCVFSSSAAMPCVITVRQVTPIVRRAMSFSAATVAIWSVVASIFLTPLGEAAACGLRLRSEEHTSELQSLMRSSHDVFCLKKKKPHTRHKQYVYTSYINSLI